jgi:hypothetical protein
MMGMAVDVPKDELTMSKEHDYLDDHDVFLKRKNDNETISNRENRL